MQRPDLKLDFRKAACPIGIIAGTLTLIIGKAGPALILVLGIAALFLGIFFDFCHGSGFHPCYLWIMAPLNLIHFSTITDFRIRMVCFFAFSYIFSCARARRKRKIRLEFIQSKPLRIWLVAFLVFSLAAAVLYMQGIHLSGDEPHYVMVAQSIVEDGDFNLENNLKDKTYYRYLPQDIPLHGKIHNRRQVTYHMPGVSFLIVPFYAIFNLLGNLIPAPLYFRLVAALFSSFFALGLFRVLQIQFPGKNISGIWLFFLCVYPLIFHSIHLYPEIPAAGLMMGAYIFAFREKKHYWLSGLFISLAFWFHVKYYPSLIVLSIIIILSLIKNKQWKSLFHFSIFPIINLCLIMTYCKILYGYFSPTAIFPGGGNYLLTPMLLRIKVLLAYFLDQRDGLFFYSPMLFLFLFGFKNRLKNQGTLLWILIPYILFHAFTTVRGAYSPAGRPLIFVLWILLLWVANFYFHKQTGTNQTGFKILAGFSLFVLIWLFYYPLFMYQPVFAQTVQRASAWLLFLGSSTVKLWKMFPSFLTQPGSFHPATLLWIVLSILLAGIFYIPNSARERIWKHQGKISIALFLILSFLFCLYPHVLLISRDRLDQGNIHLFNSSKNFRYIPDQKGFNMLAGRTYTIYLESSKPLAKLDFHLRNTDNVQVKIRNKTRVLFRSQGQGSENFSVPLLDLKSLRVKKKTVIPLEIITRTREKQNFLFLQIT